MIRQLGRWLVRPPVGVKLALFVLAALAYGASGFVYFERPGKPELSLVDGFWWALVTMSTLGYGDFFPVTAAGRFLIAYPIILIGVGFLAVAMSNLATFFVRADALNRRGLAMVVSKRHVVIIHHPAREIVAHVARELRKGVAVPPPIVLVDPLLEELDGSLAHDDIRFVRGNPALAATLERASVAEATSVVILARDGKDPSSDAASVAACLTVKSLRRELHVVAECVDGANEEVLRRAGADSVVCVANLAPGLLAHEASDPGLVHVLRDLTVWTDDTMNVYVVPVQVGGASATVMALRRWSEANRVTLLGVRRGEAIELNPSAEAGLKTGDQAVIMCQQRPRAIEV